MSSRRRWAGLVFISIAVALIIVDSTIVNVAIPSIVDDLGISSTAGAVGAGVVHARVRSPAARVRHARRPHRPRSACCSSA